MTVLVALLLASTAGRSHAYPVPPFGGEPTAAAEAQRLLDQAIDIEDASCGAPASTGGAAASELRFDCTIGDGNGEVALELASEGDAFVIKGCPWTTTGRRPELGLRSCGFIDPTGPPVSVAREYPAAKAAAHRVNSNGGMTNVTCVKVDPGEFGCDGIITGRPALKDALSFRLSKHGPSSFSVDDCFITRAWGQKDAALGCRRLT
jgi:hypothetical protein